MRSMSDAKAFMGGKGGQKGGQCELQPEHALTCSALLPKMAVFSTTVGGASV